MIPSPVKSCLSDISAIRRVVTVIKDGRVYDPAAIYRALGIRP